MVKAAKRKRPENNAEDETVEDGPPPEKMSHKKQLQRLLEKDKDFHQFLRENETDLLDFSDVDDEEGEDDVEDEDLDENDDDDDDAEQMEDDDEEDDENQGEFESARRTLVDSEMCTRVEQFLASASDADVDGIPSSVWADVESSWAAAVARLGGDGPLPSHFIDDVKIFERLVRAVLRHAPNALHRLLGFREDKAQETADGRLPHPQIIFKHWKKRQGMARRFLSLLVTFIQEVQSDSVLLSAFRTAAALSAILVHFRKLTRQLIRAAVAAWCKKSKDLQIAAYSLCSRLVASNTKLFAPVFKTMYVGWVSGARQPSAAAWPRLELQMRSFAALSSAYPKEAYPLAFVYIRQLAIHLRNALIASRKDTVASVYNWQWLCSLRIWAAVVCRVHAVEARPGSEALARLAFPLVQITSATLTAFASAKLLPIRMHCIRLLLRIQIGTKQHVPTLWLAVNSLLPDAIALCSKRSKPSGDKLAALDEEPEWMLRVPEQLAQHPQFRALLWRDAHRLLVEAAHAIRASPAFPDVTVPVLCQIRRRLKEKRLPREWTAQLKEFASVVENHALWVRAKISTARIQLTEDVGLSIALWALRKEPGPIEEYYRRQFGDKSHAQSQAVGSAV